MRFFLVAAGCSAILAAPSAHASRGSDFSVSLSAEYRDTRFLREWSGFVALQIAFDRFLMPGTVRAGVEPEDGPQTLRVEPRFTLGSGAERRERRRELGPRATRVERRLALDPRAMRDEPRLSEGPPKKENDATPAPPAAAPKAPAASPTPVGLPSSAKLARGAIRRALECAGYVEARSRLAGLAGRARSSAVLPELGVRTLRSSGQLLRLTPTSDDPYRYTQAGTSELTIEARMTWHLDRLVFADEEVTLERLRIERDAAERRLVESVLERVELWQRSRLRASDPLTEPEQRQAAEYEALAAAVELDVLTNGWFSQAIGESEPGTQAKVANPPESR